MGRIVTGRQDVTSIEAQPVVYPRGALQRLLGHPDAPPLVTFRSRLEAHWANTMDELGIKWTYEPKLLTLPNGRQYVPDFYLEELDTWLEVKGTGVPRLDKTVALASQGTSLVVAGLPPSFTPGQGYRMRFRGVVHPCAFARCPACRRYQWVAVDLKCWPCGAEIPVHAFYRHNLIPFRLAPWAGA